MRNYNQFSAFILYCICSVSWSAGLQDNQDETVRDLATGLVWQQRDDDAQRNWSDAINYCNTLALAGQKSWRLPDVKELQSILDLRVDSPAIDDAMFPGTKGSHYWSASSSSEDNAQAWSVIFNRGNVLRIDKIDRHFARCVH